MLTEQEQAIIEELIKETRFSEKVNPILIDLDKRGYIRIGKAVDMFGTPTGEHSFRVTEAGKIIIEHKLF